MAVSSFITEFSKFASLPSMRSDVNYHYFFDIKDCNVWPNSSIELSEILKPIKSGKVDKGDLDSEELLIDLANIERRFNTLIDVREVAEIGSDKSIISDGDIVIPKIQPRLGNIFLNLNHKRYLGSSELIEYCFISDTFDPTFLFYIITHPLFAKCLYYTESGKTHRRVNPAELLKYRIPIIDKKDQNSALKIIIPIEQEIQKLKSALKADNDIINSVIIKTFNFNVDELKWLDELRYISVGFSELSESSVELRNSVRFTKMRLIQQEMMCHYQCYTALDEYLLPPKTKNGWSPENNELEGETKLMGIDSLHYNGILTIDNPKFTNETRDDIDSFYIKNGDFFVSRGNTVDLVALASIAEDIEEDLLYPDIMIKLYVDETKIDKQYLAYLFNSIIGRLYFKYASRGKQQTMVKVSSDTIRNFIIPVIPLEKQREIVKEIKKASDAQNKTRRKIQELRNIIDLIVEETMNNNLH